MLSAPTLNLAKRFLEREIRKTSDPALQLVYQIALDSISCCLLQIKAQIEFIDADKTIQTVFERRDIDAKNTAGQARQEA